MFKRFMYILAFLGVATVTSCTVKETVHKPSSDNDEIVIDDECPRADRTPCR